MSLRISPPISKGIFLPLRNLVFFLAACLILQEVSPFSAEAGKFLKGALVFILGYEAIYFLNDYYDSNYDKRLRRPYNFYLAAKNKQRFWFLAGGFFTLGVVGSAFLSLTSLALYLLLVVIGLLYSAPPFRTKDIFFIRGLTLGILYALKVIFVASVFNFPFHLVPKIFLAFIICLVGFVNSLRKSYEGKIQTVEAFVFGISLLLSILIGILFLSAKTWLIILVTGVISGGLYRIALFLESPSTRWLEK